MFNFFISAISNYIGKVHKRFLRIVFRLKRIITEAFHFKFSYIKEYFIVLAKNKIIRKINYQKQHINELGISKSYWNFSILIMTLVFGWAVFDAFKIYNTQVDDFKKEIAMQSLIVERATSASVNNVENYMSYVANKVKNSNNIDYKYISDLLIKSFNYNATYDNFYSWLDVNYVDQNSFLAITSRDGILQSLTPVEKKYPIEAAKESIGRAFIGDVMEVSSDLLGSYKIMPIALAFDISDKFSGTLISDILIDKVSSEVAESLQDKDLSYLVFSPNYQLIFTSENCFDINIDQELLNKVIFNKSLSDLKSGNRKISYKEFGRLVEPIRINNTDFDFYRFSNHGFIILSGYSDKIKTSVFFNKIFPISLQLFGILALFLCSLYVFRRIKITPVINELVRRGEEALAASKAKGQFLSNISHEIRTPLNGIMGMSLDLLEAKDLSDDQRENAVIIYNSSNNLLEILNQILDFSKIEAGKLALENINFELRKVVEDLADLMATPADKKGLEIITYISNDIPKTLIGDRVRIGQILTNLCNNGIKFTSYGQISINITLEKYQNGIYYILFSVSDSGIGIEKDKIDKLFQKFEQADMSTTRKFGGTGLGLSICKELVNLMGGKIGVKSESGKGSNFWVEIPFKKSIGNELFEDKKAFDERIKQLSNKTAFVFESSECGRSVITKQLEDYGTKASLSLFNNGSQNQNDEIFAQLKNNSKVDFILVSHHIVDKYDFVKLAEQIQNDLSLKDIPLILLVSRFNKNRINKDLLEKFTKIINKPIRYNNFSTTLLESLSLIQTENKTESKPEEIIKNGMKILVCEDNDVNLKVAIKILIKMGYETDYAENGQDGFNKFLHINYDLILMDCQMPVMDGFTAVKKIRESEKEQNKKRISIIALTANAGDVDQKLCFEAGMDDFCSKPIRRDVFESLVKKWTAK